MIQSFGTEATQSFYRDRNPKLWQAIREVALRKLDQIDNAIRVEDLRWPPGNRLERLKGDRSGQYSIRINKQWRICFVWSADGPHDVEIVDYH